MTGSGSSFDPDITPAGGYEKVRAGGSGRHSGISLVKGLVACDIVGADFGFIGSSYVDVLSLNEALAALALELTVDLASSIDAVVVLIDPGDLGFQALIADLSGRGTPIEFRPTLERQRDDATEKGQIGRQKIFDGLLQRLDDTGT